MARRSPGISPSRTALNCARISALPVVASIGIPFRSPLVGAVLAPPSQFTTDPRSWQGATEIALCGRNAGKTKRAPVSRGPRHFRGGDDGIRTHDPHVANVMLSQLSYIPTYGALSREVLFCRLLGRLSNPHSANAHNARADMPPNGKSIGRRAPLPWPSS